MAVDPRAEIDSSAKIGNNVEIGPWTIIGPKVEIGDNCKIGPHVIIKKNTRLGRNNIIHPFASIGGDHQARSTDDAETWLEVGSGNVFHEFTSINRGSTVGSGVTKIGNDCLFMAYTHVAHDCEIGNNVNLVNHATLGGHVLVQDYAILGAYTAVHQFCYVGAHCFLTRGCLVSKDAMPYIVLSGNPPSAGGLNKVGLKRRGFTDEQLKVMDEAYRIIFRQGLTKAQALERLAPLRDARPDVITPMFDMLTTSERGIER